MRSVLVIALLAGLLACSGQPQAPDAEASSAATPPAPAAAETAAAAPAVATPAAAAPAGAAPDAAAPADADKVVKKIPSGYRLEKRGSKEFFCRSVTLLGSRFPKKTCFTREQLEEITSRTDSAMDDMERGMSVCAGGEACGQGS